MNAEIFVYGTLKRGECRQACWPRPPLRVDNAFVRGLLYDLGPYPALVPGDDWVMGEVWTIAAADRTSTLAVLDEIEGYDPDGKYNLYDRVELEWYGTPGADRSEGRAMAYHFARRRGLLKLRPMKARVIEGYDSPVVVWPG
ncbi:MAG: gamma-glutamylcyclotransferase family protein [Pirellulaceae bacterium]